MGTTSRRSRAVARAVLAVGVTVAAVAATSPAAAAAPVDTTSQAEQAAEWLAGQLAIEQDGTFADPLLTADAILALEATGTEETAAQQAMQWLLGNAQYALGAPQDESVLAHAKIAVTAIAGGLDPSDFGGVDLLATLRSLECGPSRVCDPDLEDRADELGRFADGTDDDQSDVTSQAWAILALERAAHPGSSDDSDGASAESVRFLLANQCPDGGFPSTIVAHQLGEWDADAPPACRSDPGVTGLVVQTLVLIGESCDAIAAAVAYLVETRAVNGAWSYEPDEDVDSPTTASASLALTAVARDTSSSRVYLTSLQEPEGSILLQEGTSMVKEQATTQAIPALAQQSLITLGTGTAAPAEYACSEPTAPTPTPTTTSPTTPTPPTPTGPEPTDPEPTDPEPTEPGRLTSTISNRTGIDGGTDLTNGGTELARTGAVSWPLALTGSLLLVAGAGLVGAANRRPRPAQS